MILRLGADYAGKASQLKAGSFLVPAGASMEEIVDIVTRGGASTCGTEVVYRIGVTRSGVVVRELDPATNRYVEKASFDPATEQTPADFTKVRGQSDTRYRIALAEGVTSWQIVEALKGIDVLEGEVEEETPDDDSDADDGGSTFDDDVDFDIHTSEDYVDPPVDKKSKYLKLVKDTIQINYSVDFPLKENNLW